MLAARWNVRGLNGSFTHNEVRSLVAENKISLLGINESRVKQHSSNRIARRLLRGWRVLFNYHHHPNGRIWVLWDPNVLSVKLLFDSSQMVLVEVTVLQKQFTFFTSFIYGFNTHLERLSLWESIRQLAPLTSTTP